MRRFHRYLNYGDIKAGADLEKVDMAPEEEKGNEDTQEKDHLLKSIKSSIESFLEKEYI